VWSARTTFCHPPCWHEFAFAELPPLAAALPALSVNAAESMSNVPIFFTVFSFVSVVRQEPLADTSAVLYGSDLPVPSDTWSRHVSACSLRLLAD
jgi:hypothetical protein